MKRVLLKLSGEFIGPLFSAEQIEHAQQRLGTLVQQLLRISDQYQIAIVIGGGNYFRGSVQGLLLGMERGAADQVGMMATVTNGLLIADFCRRSGLAVELFSSYEIQGVVDLFSYEKVKLAFERKAIVIFVGGTGVPLFSTDTCAVVRAVQIGAQEIWKATKVNGIYAEDPIKNPAALFIKKLSFTSALEQRIAVVDRTALELAQQHDKNIRVFSMKSQALLEDLVFKDAGSLISNN